MPELLGKATYIGQYLYYPPTVIYASCEPSLRLHKLWVATWGPPVAPGPQCTGPGGPKLSPAGVGKNALSPVSANRPRWRRPDTTKSKAQLSQNLKTPR